MELTDEGRKVLEIVRRVLVARTHWATWAQTLMTATEVEVKRAPPHPHGWRRGGAHSGRGL